MINKSGTGTLAAMLMGLIGFASAQDSSMTKPTTSSSMRTLSGCLQKGDDKYVLTPDDGGIWELKERSVKLDGYR